MANQHTDDEPTPLAARAERGAAALVTLSAPDEHRMGAMLARIPAALGVGFLSPIFRALATWPEWFESAWVRTEPRIGGAAWEAATRRVREAARELLPAVGPGEHEVNDPTAAYLAMQGRLLPELLVLARVWYDADGTGTTALDEPLASRAIDAAAAPSGELDASTERLLDELRAAHQHPRVLSVYRAIAAGGPLFAAEAPTLIERASAPAADDARTALRDAVGSVAAELAPGVPGPPEGAREILALFGGRLIPDLIIDTTWLRRRAGLEGDD